MTDAQTYRWNVAEHAAGYDAAAAILHPHYDEIQQTIVDLVPQPDDAEFLAVDLGGGSGRLAEKLLEQFSRASVVVVDQSQAFLDLASARLSRFRERARCVVARLQDNWTAHLPAPPAAIVSTSAIHHLAAEEKRDLYRRAYEALAPGGVLLNGDEIRAEVDSDYLRALVTWSDHMLSLVDSGRIAAPMRPLLEGWRERNVTRFGEPRSSGDDCHETVATQLDYFRACGFRQVASLWQKQLWAVLQGIK